MTYLLWWHWILVGIVLVVLELVVPSFTIFWFGLAAILTGLLLALLPGLPLAWQLLVFVAASLGFTFLWFRYFRPRRKTSSRTDEQLAIGQTGIAATRALTPGEIGQAVFSIPIMGHEAWEYTADEPIHTGERLRIVAVLVAEGENAASAPPHKILKVEKV